MKKLNMTQMSDLGDHDEAISVSYAELEEAVAGFNDAIHKAWSKVEETLAKHNEARAAASEMLSGIVGDMETYRDARSGKWQEGEAGEAYGEWIAAYQEAENELAGELELDMPDELDLPDVGIAPLVELPESPNA